VTDLVPVSAGIATTGVDQNPAAVYLARLSEGSRRTMRTALARLADTASNGQHTAQTFPWHQLRYQHTQALRAHLTEGMAPATVNKHLSALRGVLKEAWRLGLMTAEDYQRAADIENLTETRLPAGRHVDTGEIHALVNVCQRDRKPIGLRDGAMLGVLFGAGLRVGELVSIELDDLNTETGEIKVRKAKRRKQRTAYVQGGSLAAVRDWLDIRSSDPGALFCPVNKAGRVTVRGITTQAVHERFIIRGQEAGLAAAFSPHDARRTWIGNLLDAGADIATVQHMAGHASPTTTSRYDRRGERAKLDATGRLHFPWSPARTETPR
jgi:site-specific recombinase XerC